MPRLPDLIVTEIEVTWPEDYKQKDKELHNMFGLAVRKAVRANKKKGGKGKDETD